MPDGATVAEDAAAVMQAFDTRTLMDLPSHTDPTLEESKAYEIAREVHRRRIVRGETPVGRKIGFTNRASWPALGISRPMWGFMYDTTVSYAEAGAEVGIGHLLEPRIETEIMLHFAQVPPVTRDANAILESVDWIAMGYEIAQCPYADWEFRPPDAIAAFGLHGLVVIGHPVAVFDIGDCADKLRHMTVALSDGTEQVTGAGSVVLGSPLDAFAEFIDILAGQPDFPPVSEGEIVTTGTLTPALPLKAGSTWTATADGIGLPELSVTFAA
jgi:2-oxo-3-hexenedioate decarboxylase